MNNPSISDIQVVLPRSKDLASSANPGHTQIPGWLRLLVAMAIFVILGLVGAGVWMFGILMFTFALDGANSGQLPSWLEPFMLVVWPVSIALVPIIPAVMTICRARWRWVFRAAITTAGIAAVVFVVGVVALFSSL